VSGEGVGVGECLGVESWSGNMCVCVCRERRGRRSGREGGCEEGVKVGVVGGCG